MSDPTAAGDGTERERAIALDDAIGVYLERKAVGDPDGPGAGAYATNAESILRRFATWAEREGDVDSLAALESTHLRDYASALGARTDRGSFSAASADTYYAVVRAFLSWCVRVGLLAENPAATDAAESALPSARHDQTGDRLRPEHRRRLEAYVRDRALESGGGDRSVDERRRRLREYALVSLLAHSSVRGAELFSVPADDRRTGATWEDVDFYAGTIRVLGRSQRAEEVALYAPARTPLRRYRVVLDPPSNDWPLFPTRHAPSIARHVREALRERGHDEEAIEALLDGTTAIQVARGRSIAPPAITTEGARSVLKRLCVEAGVDADDGYLTPRGVRADPDDGRGRREATTSSPALRASVGDRSLAVPHRRPLVDVRPGGDEDAPRRE